MFPSDTAEELRSEWISSNFAALEEYPIWSSSPDGEIYRFTYLPTFRNPVSIRVKIRDDGVGYIFYKRSDGASGYDPGELSAITKRELSIREAQEVRARLGFLKECRDPQTKRGFDGSYWIFEHRDRTGYCAVYVWQPRTGKWRQAGEFLFDLVGYRGPRR